MTQPDLGFQLPELTVEDFQRAWTCFELIATAKEWNNEKWLAIVSTLLYTWKNYRLLHKIVDKNDIAALKSALQEKAGLKTDPLVASKNFNVRDQQPNKKIDDCVSDLKHLFKQAYPGEEVDSAVLLQRFITELRPPIACQVLLQNKPANMKDAIESAVTVQYAPNFKGVKTGLSSEPINLLHSKDSKHNDHQLQDEYSKLHKTVETLAKQVESLETA